MKRFFALTSTILTIFTISASAQALYWDPGQTASASAGGTGNWDATSQFWFDGVSSDVAWTSGDAAFFEGTAGTVTLMASTAAANLYFTNATGNYYITNATGAEVLTVNNTIDTGGGEHTIAALLSNSGTLTKTGAGRLHLPVDNTAGMSGNVMINQGSLSLEKDDAAGNNNTITIADGAALEFNGYLTNLLENYFNITASGTGITNSGAIRTVSLHTQYSGNITLAENNSLFYADSNAVFDGYGNLSANGDYNLYIGGPGLFRWQSGSFSLGAGTLVVEGPATFDMYAAPSTINFGGVLVESGATFGVSLDGDFGTIPGAQDPTNVVLDGGTLSSTGNYTMNGLRGITVTTNGGTIADVSTTGTFTTGSIHSTNTAVTFNSSATIHIAASGTTNVLNLGMGSLVKNGNGDAGTSFETTGPIFSNLVVNAGSYTFNYDQSSPNPSGLGALPTTLNPSNIVLNGGSLHVGHSTTLAGTRGIFVTTRNGTIQDVTGSATLTIASPITGPGSMTFPLGKSGSSQTVILTGANTYSGTTTVGGSITLNVGNNGSTGSLGTGNTTVSGTLTFNRTGSYSYGGNISGTGPVNKAASGTVTLTGACTYTGATTVSAGTLLMNNTNASAITVSSGGTLGGTGVFGGAVTVNSGGTLALGNGTLSASNNVSIAGNVSVSVNKSLTPSSGMAIVTGTLANTGTGTITVNNAGPGLVAGDTFQLFSQPVSGGNNLTITGSGVQWANNLAANGSISVVGPLPQPEINKFSLVGTNLVISGTNGYAGGQYYELASTNVALPLSSWKPVWTNTFLSGGLFSITNPIKPGTPQQFYLLQVH